MTEHSICKNCGREYTAEQITNAFCSEKCWLMYEEVSHEVYEE